MPQRKIRRRWVSSKILRHLPQNRKTRPQTGTSQCRGTTLITGNRHSAFDTAKYAEQSAYRICKIERKMPELSGISRHITLPAASDYTRSVYIQSPELHYSLLAPIWDIKPRFTRRTRKLLRKNRHRKASTVPSSLFMAPCLSTSLRQSLSRLSFSIKITRLLY